MSKMKDLLLEYNVDEITVASLLQSYDNLLYNKEKVDKADYYRREDLLYYDETLNALEKVIKYYTVNGDELIKKTIRERRDERDSRLAKFRLGNMNSLDF